VEYLGDTTLLHSMWSVVCADRLRVNVDLLACQGTRHADRRALAALLREQIGTHLHGAEVPAADGLRAPGRMPVAAQPQTSAPE
jgi:hypothetical protein